MNLNIRKIGIPVILHFIVAGFSVNNANIIVLSLMDIIVYIFVIMEILNLHLFMLLRKEKTLLMQWLKKKTKCIN